ncbi:MAG: hypothetical protein QW223_09835 [Candidatus Caldarchaeum sp.]
MDEKRLTAPPAVHETDIPQHLQATADKEIRLIMTEKAVVCYNQALERLRDPFNVDGMEQLRGELELEYCTMKEVLQHRVKTLETLMKKDSNTAGKALEEVRKRIEGVRLVWYMLNRIKKLSSYSL